MNYLYFVGIDMSKEWFDAAWLAVRAARKIQHRRFENSPSGFKAFLKWLRQAGISPQEVFICLEHTGVYTVPFCTYMASQGLAYTLVPGAEIANSQGITRGKNDKLDAKRIARYAYKNRDEIRQHTLPEEPIRKLKALLSYRDRLLKTRHSLSVSTKEMQAFEREAVVGFIAERSEQLLQQIQEELKQVEQHLQHCIQSHEELQKNYTLLLSVPGIGKMNALYLLVVTKNFVTFDCPKKFAAYAGIAPFQNQSGKSKKSKSKVSHQANKKMKTLLTNAVVCSLNRCAEYKRYYERQIARGKNEYSVKNAVRNKIVSRAFAVIKRQSPYVNTHAYA